jgi:Uncharacterized protein conserved in bacteria (DUF2321)
VSGVFTLAVCRSGDVITNQVIDATGRLEFSDGVSFTGEPLPTRRVKMFCPDCGAPVLTACGACGEPIPRPDYHQNRSTLGFCVGSAEPFPWASRE